MVLKGAKRQTLGIKNKPQVSRTGLYHKTLTQHSINVLLSAAASGAEALGTEAAEVEEVIAEAIVEDLPQHPHAIKMLRNCNGIIQQIIKYWTFSPLTQNLPGSNHESPYRIAIILPFEDRQGMYTSTTSCLISWLDKITGGQKLLRVLYIDLWWKSHFHGIGGVDITRE